MSQEVVLLAEELRASQVEARALRPPPPPPQGPPSVKYLNRLKVKTMAFEHTPAAGLTFRRGLFRSCQGAYVTFKRNIKNKE